MNQKLTLFKLLQVTNHVCRIQKKKKKHLEAEHAKAKRYAAFIHLHSVCLICK